jgi:hypothetical protein
MTTVPPVLPTPTPIPREALDAWAGLSRKGQITIPLAKVDVEDFYNCIIHLISAHTHLQRTIIQYSQNNLGLANEHLVSSQQYLIESQSKLNELMTTIMITATGRK